MTIPLGLYGAAQPVASGAVIAGSSLLSGANGANAATYTTASTTPISDGLNLLWVIGTGANSGTAPTVTGAGMTWTLTRVAGALSTLVNAYLFVGSGTPSTGALTISWSAGNNTSNTWFLDGFAGATGIAQIDSISASSGTSVSVSLPAAATAPTYGLVVSYSQTQHTISGTWAALGTQNQGSPNNRCSTVWDASAEDTLAATWGSSSENIACILELE